MYELTLSSSKISSLKSINNNYIYIDFPLLEFEKINGSYNENQQGEPDLNHLAYDSEFDLEGDNSSSDE